MQSRMMMLVMLLGLATSPVFAHGGGAHLKGTISALTADRITVKAADGHEAEAAITEQTLFVRGRTAGKRGDLKQGDRVIVHTRKKGSGLEAVEIHSGRRPKKIGARMPEDER